MAYHPALDGRGLPRLATRRAATAASPPGRDGRLLRGAGPLRPLASRALHPRCATELQAGATAGRLSGLVRAERRAEAGRAAPSASARKHRLPQLDFGAFWGIKQRRTSVRLGAAGGAAVFRRFVRVPAKSDNPPATGSGLLLPRPRGCA